MRSNGRPSLAISTLSPLSLDLHEGKNAWIMCTEPACGLWVEVCRGLVQVHRREGVRCAGSKRHVVFDLSPAQHDANRVVAKHEARRAVQRTAVDALESGWLELARVPVAPALHQIAARRAPAHADRAVAVAA